MLANVAVLKVADQELVVLLMIEAILKCAVVFAESEPSEEDVNAVLELTSVPKKSALVLD